MCSLVDISAVVPSKASPAFPEPSCLWTEPSGIRMDPSATSRDAHSVSSPGATAVRESTPVKRKCDTKAQKYIDLKMGEEPFRSGLVGVLAVTLKGDTLAEYGSLRKMVPASNMKLISTGLAMEALGANYRFTTRLGYTGHISGGALHGDLYIIGGGDPTIASGDGMAPVTDSLFAMWKRALTRAGIRKIDGLVIGDGRFFDGSIENENWSYNDLGTDFGAGGNGLCFRRNIQTINAEPTSVGAKANAAVAYPSVPWLRFRVNAVTAPAGTGDNLYLFNSDMAPVAELRGSLGLDKGRRELKCSNKFGALTCAWNFAGYLRKSGVESSGAADVDAYGSVREAGRLVRDAAYVSARPAAGSGNMTVIGEFRSPSLVEIAKVTNARSDNFYAETLFRILSKERTGSASYDSCNVVVVRGLERLGVDCGSGVRIVDGSGLARHNYVSPDFFCRFLKAMAGTGVARQYVSTLPIAGGSRMRGCQESLRRRVRMKSGSMNGVLCYSGYILPSADSSSASSGSALSDDTVVFSIMTNNIVDNPAEVRRFIDTLLNLLCTE